MKPICKSGYLIYRCSKTYLQNHNSKYFPHKKTKNRINQLENECRTYRLEVHMSSKCRRIHVISSPIFSTFM